MKNKYIITIFLISISAVSYAQTWNETSTTLTSPKTYVTQTQLAEHTWGGYHALLFNAYKSPSTVSGGLATTGNTKYSNNQGGYGGGAGAIMFVANGGIMDFRISPAAGASGGGTNVSWGDPKMRILRNGEVGIGTTGTDPTGFKLSVAGKVRATEIKVDALPWPDYVFTPSYELMSLNELEIYIKKEGHLPNIPDAELVEEDGVELGDMNAKLLEKIEELTLYIIDQNKRLEDQKIRLEVLESKSK